MLNVLLICSMGASTGVLCEKIKKCASEQNYEIKIWATALSQSNDEIPKADIILLGPQVRFMLKKISEKAQDKPIKAIDMMQYGKMDAEGILDMIKDMKGNIKK